MENVYIYINCFDTSFLLSHGIIFCLDYLQSCKRVIHMYACPLCLKEYQETRVSISCLKTRRNLKANYMKKKMLEFEDSNEKISSQDDIQNKENIGFISTSNLRLSPSTSVLSSKETSDLTVTTETILSFCDSLQVDKHVLFCSYHFQTTEGSRYLAEKLQPA